MRVLGISAYYHDSAAALVEDGRVIFAGEEERFSRMKHDNAFPFKAVEHCLASAGVSMRDIDCVAYYEKPLRKFERILEQFVDTYPFSAAPFMTGIPEWLTEKMTIERTVREKLGFTREMFFVPHHLSHASAAFFPSPFERASILTIDGIGEYQTTGLWSGDGNTITPLGELNFPHSLGLLYATFTAFLGFKVNEDEYKLMGLAAYGSSRYAEDIRSIIDIKDDGSFNFDMRYFLLDGTRMWSKNFESLFGAPRTSGELTRRHKDIAASIQAVTEEVCFKILRHLYALDGSENLCIGGGVSLNALANGKYLSNTPFKQLCIFGAAGDSGAALGAALAVSHMRGTKRAPLSDLRLGTLYGNAQIERELRSNGIMYEKFTDESDFCGKIAELLGRGHTIGWFQGKMEFGPRALGSRSLLASPQRAEAKIEVNRTKGREEFRPFGASVLAERAREYVRMPDSDFPFMNFCFEVRAEKRGEIPAVVHEDGTCRIQTVAPSAGRYYSLLKSFERLTGVPFLLNTSFNTAGDPIVESPAQAISTFLKTPLECLAIGDFLALKNPDKVRHSSLRDAQGARAQ